MHVKFPVVRAKRGDKKGYSKWGQLLNRHLWECCDCGLVHDFQFKLIPADRGKKQVVYRLRRAPRYTTQQRKARGNKMKYVPK